MTQLPVCPEPYVYRERKDVTETRLEEGLEEVVGAIPDFKITRTEAGAVGGGSVLRTLAALQKTLVRFP